MKGFLDGREEHREIVNPPSALEVYEQLKGLEVIFRKYLKATAPCGESLNWSEEYIF